MAKVELNNMQAKLISSEKVKIIEIFILFAEIFQLNYWDIFLSHAMIFF